MPDQNVNPLDLGGEPITTLNLPPSERADATRSTSKRRPWRWVVGVVAILLLVATLAATAKLIGVAAPAAELPLTGRIALLPFIDATVDRSSAWIETGLMEMVAETVARTTGNAMVPPARLRKALESRSPRRGAGGTLDLRDPAARERARGLALAAGADQVLDVTVTGEHGKGYIMELELFDGDDNISSTQLKGADPLEIADALAFSVARALSKDIEPRRLQRLFSRSPFVDRIFATGLAELRAGSPAGARPYFEIALKHRSGFFQAKAQLADCARQLGELDLAVELTDELVREAQSRGERALEAHSLRSLASLKAIQGQLDEASEFYAQAYAVHLDMSDRPAQATALYEMARLALAGDDTTRAEELYVEMLRIQQDLGDRLGEADTLFQIGSLLLSGRDDAGAEQVLADSRKLALETGDVWTEMKVTTSLGEIAQLKGELETAKRLWRRALGFYDQHGENPRRLLLSYKLAQLLVRTEELDEAEDRLHDMRELAAELENRQYEARASLGLAWILLRTGYSKQAKTHIDRALELDRWLDDRKLMQLVIAWYAYEQGNYRLALQTQAGIKRHSANRWMAADEAFLQVFREADVLGRRLPLPGEAGYVEPRDRWPKLRNQARGLIPG